MKKIILALLLITAVLHLSAQQMDESLPESDTSILNRISQWQDLKFGLMLHWGMYSQWSTVESWSICNEEWVTHRNGANYVDYKTAYQRLNETFNPVNFNPDLWATYAAKAGMKYLVFTTKHHDGFCMFDSKETNYSIADNSCPFHSDVTAAIVNAFRKQNFWIGLYFSKADWHHDDYWAQEWTTPDRNVNYNPQDYPDRWQRFCDFTKKQIKELTSNYGTIDILWLDGGWVRPEWSLNDEYRTWLGCKQYVQDINIKEIAATARENNPNMIIVDRTVHGKYENYQTPEQFVPDSILSFPWETCMSMANSWSYVDNDEYKPANSIIHYLIDIVAKGGNYLLNVGPNSYGEFPAVAVERLQEIGKWMSINSSAIYNSRPCFTYSLNNLRFTQTDNEVFLFYLLKENESLNNKIEFFFPENLTVGSVTVLGCNQKVNLKRNKGIYVITIPQVINLPHAVCLVLKKEKK